ncbi:hypothetical protein ACOME3_000060 [Neoechinorhynchus agilis]
MKNKEAEIPVVIEGVRIRIEFDTGAAESIITRALWHRIGRPKLRATNELRAFGGNKIENLGRCSVSVKFGSNWKIVEAVVVPGSGRSLFGLPWMLEFCLKIPAELVDVNKIDLGRDDKSEELRSKLKNAFPSVFNKGVIMKQNGPLSYVVQTTEGEKRIHADHLRKRAIGKRDQEDSKQNINEEVGGDLRRDENEHETDQQVERGNTRQETEQRSSTESSEVEGYMSDEEFRLPDDKSERNEDESEVREEVNEGLGLRVSTRIRRKPILPYDKYRYLQGEET